MRNVVFVAPFFLATTLRFVDAVTRVPGTRVGLVSQDPLEKLPTGTRSRLAAHAQVADGVDAGSVLGGIQQIEARIGPVERLVGTLEELQVPLGELRDHLGLPGLGAAAGQNFRDKSQMKSTLKAAGLPCARHGLAGTPEEARATAAELGYPLVIKPPAGAGARGTFRIESDEQLETSLVSLAPRPDRPVLLEEFVQGEEHSFDSIMVDGQLVWWSINHYYPSPLEVLETPWIQWCVLLPREVDDPRYAAIRQAAAQALPVLGMRTGLSHMEWFRRPDGSVAISEVERRPPGAQFTSLISWAHDFDLYAAWAHLMVFDQFEPRPRPYAAGAAYLKGQGRGRVTTIEGIEELQREMGDLVVEARLPHPGQSPTGTYEGEGYVIVRHPETEVVREALGRIVQRLRVNLG